MRDIEELIRDREAEELGESIERAFKRYRVNIGITCLHVQSDKIIFEVKLKGDTREAQLRARLSDVQQRLECSLFQLTKEGFRIFIVVAKKQIVYPLLSEVLSDQRHIEYIRNMQLPYMVGFVASGRRIVVDLAQFPHLLIAGATRSGKTVGIQAMIVSIIYCRLPSQVNFILIDVGATDLIPFNGIPHLSCPVVCDRETACQVLVLLVKEMERRMKLQISDNDQFEQIPRLVLVIDEFPALFMGVEDKKVIKVIADSVSSLLQRGRHAKIHVVLAAQNPTIQNMKVDLGNITARIAFKCAKKNFSETILGEGGAENLLGKGDMYFKSPEFSGLERIQGAYITSNELSRIIRGISIKSIRYSIGKYKINLSDNSRRDLENDLGVNLIANSNHSKKDTDERMFAQIVIWALGQNEISCNTIMKTFGYGWNRASHFIDRLYEFGIVGELDAKLPRKVILQSIDEIPANVMKLLINNSISAEMISNIIGNRN